MPDKTQDAAFTVQQQRRVRAASCLVLALLALLAWQAFQGSDSGPVNRKSRAGQAAIEAEGVRSIVVRQNGKKLWEFAAQRIEISADNAYATATGLERGVLYKNGAPHWRLRARNVRLNQRTNDVEAWGAVQARGPEGIVITTTRALWLHKAGRLLCPEPFQARLREMDVSSASASYDLRRDELRCNSTVTVSGAKAVLTSERAMAWPRRGLVSFEGAGDILIRRSALPRP